MGPMTPNTGQGILRKQMAAAGAIIVVPRFLLSYMIRPYFVEGVTMGAVK